MDIIHLVPSPTHILRVGLSLMSYSLLTNSWKSCDTKTTQPRLLDVNSETGFFPPRPLPRLPKTFSAWEKALEDAREVLRLADDDSDEALELREAGEQWRANIRSVGTVPRHW